MRVCALGKTNYFRYNKDCVSVRTVIGPGQVDKSEVKICTYIRGSFEFTPIRPVHVLVYISYRPARETSTCDEDARPPLSSPLLSNLIVFSRKAALSRRGCARTHYKYHHQNNPLFHWQIAAQRRCKQVDGPSIDWFFTSGRGSPVTGKNSIAW